MFRFRVTRWYMVYEGEVFVKIGSVIGEFIAGINRNKTVAAWGRNCRAR
jgi:hypothetical protein